MWCETAYIKKHKYWNNYLSKLGWNKRFSLGDLVRFCPEYNKFIMHPYQYDFVSEEPNEILRIGHSPGIKENRRLVKGTDIILNVIEQLQKSYKFEFDLMEGLKHDEVIQRKRKCHIFIDQIGDRSPRGVGRNSEEAIAMGSITLCDLTNWRYPSNNLFWTEHPIIHVPDTNTLTNELKMLFENQEYFNSMKKRTLQWRYTIGYENIVGYIMSIWE